MDEPGTATEDLEALEQEVFVKLGALVELARAEDGEATSALSGFHANWEWDGRTSLGPEIPPWPEIIGA